MPQTMPMSRSILFMMFSIALITFAATNYYTSMQKTSSIQMGAAPSKKSMNWMW